MRHAPEVGFQVIGRTGGLGHNPPVATRSQILAQRRFAATSLKVSLARPGHERPLEPASQSGQSQIRILGWHAHDGAQAAP